MIYCQKCGTQNPEIAAFCNKCGADLKRLSNNTPSATYQPVTSSSEDSAGIGWIILALLLPIVGFILYFVWKSNYPKKASHILVAAIIGFVVNFIILMS